MSNALRTQSRLGAKLPHARPVGHEPGFTIPGDISTGLSRIEVEHQQRAKLARGECMLPGCNAQRMTAKRGGLTQCCASHTAQRDALWASKRENLVPLEVRKAARKANRPARKAESQTAMLTGLIAGLKAAGVIDPAAIAAAITAATVR